MKSFIIYSIIANVCLFSGITDNFHSALGKQTDSQEAFDAALVAQLHGWHSGLEYECQRSLPLQEPAAWDLSVEGFSPAYYDKARNAIAVNTVEQPTDQWAAATTTFKQPSGVYSIHFTSLLESDGECFYVLKIGGKKVMNFQNPSIYGKDIEEYAPHVVEVKNITIEKGSLIQVEFLPHSNGKVPEGDGFGFARGRWKSQIGFIPQQ
ncbi:hypothetical protein [Cyclobacterium plantarum]|uniref:PA14 domain-containing protein n=1 Tax=Cyclobacterium plantarum TaxID=2716263 RepID=A0ABX0H2Z6_9BACT|nr:hypothetical protein [Cyclobacterium plantarum]NHE56174.1 hypothetical protein [Cyclobacterium plantarum]